MTELLSEALHVHVGVLHDVIACGSWEEVIYDLTVWCNLAFQSAQVELDGHVGEFRNGPEGLFMTKCESDISAPLWIPLISHNIYAAGMKLKMLIRSKLLNIPNFNIPSSRPTILKFRHPYSHHNSETHQKTKSCFIPVP